MYPRVRPGVLTREVTEVLCPRGVEYGLEHRRHVRSIRVILVPVGDRDLVPRPDSDVIGLRQVDLSIRSEGDEWVWVVHDRDASLLARVVVVTQTEGVPHFVRRQLPDARQRHLGQLRRGLVAVEIRRKEPFGDEVVLADPERAERHVSLDDLAGARVGHRVTLAPAACRTMHPLDHVVADVEAVGALRHDFHPERFAIARCLEGLVPPAGAVEQA